MKYFTHTEFDSPDVPGSGSNMDADFLEMLDDARACSCIPYRITSGFRTRAYNESLIRRAYSASRNSSHLKGLAADIAAVNSEARMRIVAGLLAAGFTRIGIGKTFVHVDCDPDKHNGVMWVYDG